jgi:hypothetical protein
MGFSEYCLFIVRMCDVSNLLLIDIFLVVDVFDLVFVDVLGECLLIDTSDTLGKILVVFCFLFKTSPFSNCTGR